MFAFLARVIVARLVRAFRSDRRAVCGGAATDLALLVHMRANAPLQAMRWDGVAWAGTKDVPKLACVGTLVRGRLVAMHLTDARQCWGPGLVFRRSLGALVARGVRLHVAVPVLADLARGGLARGGLARAHGLGRGFGSGPAVDALKPP